MTSQQFEVGQWVRSIAVGKAPAFNAEVIARVGREYIIRDAFKLRYSRQQEHLEPLQ